MLGPHFHFEKAFDNNPQDKICQNNPEQQSCFFHFYVVIGLSGSVGIRCTCINPIPVELEPWPKPEVLPDVMEKIAW